MTQTEQRAFKISLLSSIENIENLDLLLVSDYEGGGCYSKKMSIGLLMTSEPTKFAVSSEVSSQLAKGIDDKISAFMKAHFMDLLQENWESVFDLIDGERNNVMMIGNGQGAK